MYSAILSNQSNSDTHSLPGGSWVFRFVLCFLFVALSVLVSPARLQAQELALPAPTSLDVAPPTQDNSYVLGANDKYIGLCRRHWMSGDLGPDFDINR